MSHTFCYLVHTSIPYAQMAHWKQTEQLFQPDVNVPSGQGAHDLKGIKMYLWIRLLDYTNGHDAC